MNKAKLIIDKDFIISKVDKRIYGSFIEHLGRAVYTGIYEIGHPQSDANNFRKDVLELVKELGSSIVRYPGGNFLSGYNWRDGIGAVKDRPRRLDLAWMATEPNLVGTDEFIDWCRLANVEPMYAVNMGTGTPYEAGALLEYCNHHSGTQLSDLRIANGHKDPHNIKVWCIGNEMDGSWQTCHLDAHDYGKKAKETAKIMKWIDPTIELVTCGSSSTDQPSYPEWDRIALEYTYEHVDYISLHHYFGNRDNDTKSFLNSHITMSNFIKSVISTADYVKAKNRGKKDIMLSFDEWNVWFHSNNIPHARWAEAPRDLEDIYNLEDALAVGGLMCSLLNHSHRVKMACLAQLVNVIAPIMTEPKGIAWRQTIFYPLMHCAKYGHGTVLQGILKSPKMETKSFDSVDSIYQTVVYNEDKEEIVIFALNSDDKDIEFSVDVRSFDQKIEMIEHIVLNGNDLKATNDLKNIDKVLPRNEKIHQNLNEILIPHYSWNVLRFKLKK